MIREKRNIELSTVYFLENEFDSNWSGVNVVLSFAKVMQVDNPVVCIRLINTESLRREIGTTEHNKQHMLVIDIFANSNAQRNDLSDFILDTIYAGYPYYEHTYDSNKNYIRTQDGRVSILQIIRDEAVENFDAVSKKEQYRHQMTLLVSRY